jgi:predicted  nucleic acid-binding Zn-ribbon protein
LENKLRNLFALQTIDSNLDELEEMKGDLPAQVRELEAKHAGLTAERTGFEKTMRESFAMRDKADSDIISLKEKVERYKKQQFAVRNNREYDALTKEMDAAAEGMGRLEKEMESLEAKATLARSDIETTKKEIEEVEKLLQEARAALEEVSKTTETEELIFTHQREKLLVRIAKADLMTYERIRKAKKGKAVVPVRRGACGGCFNKVPPQKLLELRQNKRVYMCEHCARILVSDEIVEKSSSLA